jgi:hypothetical protein
MDWAAVGGFVTVCAAALALLIKQLEQSKCKKIKCCCFECDRELRVGEVADVVVPEPNAV